MSAAFPPEAIRQWRAALAGPRMHHAWLLAGKRGLGKGAFAAAAARDLVEAEKAGEHPDILHLTYGPKDDKEERKRADGKDFERARSIRIAQIRAMQRRLSTRPTLGARRAIVIDPADDLERSAANALLKSLEEPPVGTYFLLVAHNPARLLPTIRSRCRVLRFNPLGPEATAEALAELAPEVDGEARRLAARYSGGSVGTAQRLIAEDLLPAAELMRQLTREGDPDFILRGRLSGAIGTRPDRARMEAVFDLARAVLAGRMADVAGPQIAALGRAHADLVTLAGQAPTYNFDPAFLAAEIGGLLASVAAHKGSANV